MHVLSVFRKIKECIYNTFLNQFNNFSSNTIWEFPRNLKLQKNLHNIKYVISVSGENMIF